MLPPGRLLYVRRHRGWSAAGIDAAPTRGQPVAADSVPEDRVSRPDFGSRPSPAKSHGQTSAGSSRMAMVRWSLWCVLSSRRPQRKCRGGSRWLVLAAAAAGWSAIWWAPRAMRSRLLPGGSRRAGMRDRSGGSSGDHGACSPGQEWPSRTVVTTSPARLVRRMTSSR